MRAPARLIPLLACLCAGPAAAGEPGLAVEQAWIREAPPGATVLAGYLALENRGAAPVVVGAFHSPDFDRIELHHTQVEQGVARMLPVERLELAPGERASLEPGGMHLMLFEPQRTLQQGDRVEIRLELAEGGCHDFVAVVRRTAGEDAHHHHHH